MDIVGLYEQLVIFVMRLTWQAIKLLGQGLLFGGLTVGQATPPFLRWLKKRLTSLAKLSYWVFSTQLIPGVFFASFLIIKLIVGLVKSVVGMFGGRVEAGAEQTQGGGVTEMPAQDSAATYTPFAAPQQTELVRGYVLQPATITDHQATKLAAQTAPALSQPAVSITRQEPAGKSAVEAFQAAFSSGAHVAEALIGSVAQLLKFAGKGLGSLGEQLLMRLDEFRIQLLQPGLAAAGQGGSSAVSYGVRGIGLLIGMLALGTFKIIQFAALGIVWLVPQVFGLVGLLGSILVRAAISVSLAVANLVGFTGWLSIALAKLTLKLLSLVATGLAKTGITITQTALAGVGLVGKLVIQLAKASSFASQKLVKTSVKHSHKLAVNQGLPFMAKLQSTSIVLLSTAVWGLATGSLKLFQLIAALLMKSQALTKKLDGFKLPTVDLSVKMPKFELLKQANKTEAAKIFEQKQVEKLKQITEIYSLAEPGEESIPAKLPHNPRRFVWLSRLALSGIVVSLLSLAVFMFPDLFFRLIPYQTESVVSAVDQSKLGEPNVDLTKYAVVKLPQKDESLPQGQWLRIPKIGVETQIQEHPSATYETALRNGVWRVPEFGDPTTSVNYPMIVVAHRYGYLNWSNEFRKKNSFYQLDKLQPGDTFEVIWDQRKFVYEIYAAEEGKDVTDYSADVVLYTCKFLNSQVRILRYAKRIEI